MNKLFSLLIASAFTLFVTSCATTHPNEKLLVGSWTAQKVSVNSDTRLPVIDPNYKGKPELPQDTSKVGKKGNKAGNERTAEDLEQRKAQKIYKIIQSEERSSLIINANKTAEKIYPGNTYKAKWKLKKDGTVLVAKSKEHGKFRIDILKITDSSMVVAEHLDIVDITVKYLKK